MSRTSAEVPSCTRRSSFRRSSLSRGVPSRLVSLPICATARCECRATQRLPAPFELIEKMLLESFWMSCVNVLLPSAAKSQSARRNIKSQPAAQGAQLHEII